MAQIYIAFVDTPGFFAGMIRQVIKQKYIHVVLSMDAELEEHTVWDAEILRFRCLPDLKKRIKEKS